MRRRNRFEIERILRHAAARGGMAASINRRGSLMVRNRKNIDCLTSNELHDLREALARMYQLPSSNPSSFARQASFHGGPPTTYCKHGAPGFFTWHRAELKSFEDALRAVGCCIMLPYWDWSSAATTGIPAACRNATYVNRSGATVANPLYAGPRPAGGVTSRSGSINTTAFGDLSAQVQGAMSNASFSSFQSTINGVHGSVHVRVGGDMGGVPSAAYDPIFYLHHANIDRIWARWQQLHPGPLAASEADLELQPFTRPYTLQWQRGSDVISTEALGYRYQPWCFWLPPIRLWEIVQIPFTPILRERLTAAPLVVRSQRMQAQSMEVRVFVNQPNAGVGTSTIGNPGFAGVLGFFGHGSARDAKGTEAGSRNQGGAGAAHDHAGHSHGAEGHSHGPERHALPGGHSHGEGEHAGHSHSAAADGDVAGERFDVEVDIAAALRRASTDGERISLKLVAVDASGNEVPAEKAAFDAIELAIEAEGAGDPALIEAKPVARPAVRVAAPEVGVPVH
jgi:tyrosinase